jgi:EAL domain-containing protein (putative c-di-GMP-specific phosphodiesterase class I)
LLLRHRGGDDSLVSAGSLIATAEKNGEMASIDRWVLNQALTWLSANEQAIDELGFVAVNLSGGSLNDEFFKTFVIALLQRHPVAASRVVLEITETVATQDIFMTRQFAGAVRATGARIALDDFGSGYSNFSSLTDMPASFLKIDGRFVNSLRKNAHDHNGTGLSIIRTISLLAHELQMSCVAEWVEDLETLQTLRALGVDFAQGHAIAHPVQLDRLLAAAGNPKLLVNDHVVELIQSPVKPDLHAMETLAEKVQSRSGSVERKEQDAFIAL